MNFKILTKLSFFALGLFIILPASAIAAAAPEKRKVVEAQVINNQGEQIGTLKLTQGTKGVLINIKLSSLPPGYHGMHFHKVGDCSDHDAFKTALGHVDPFSKPHGFLNPEGPHEGNLPNIIVSKDGTVEVELYSTMVSLIDGDANLLDKDGSALIIHTDRDDHNTQPIGGAGGRIACAEIKN